MTNQKLRAFTHELFDKDLNDESIPVEEFDRLEVLAEEVIKEFGWNEVYLDWIEYLHEECDTDEKVVNFATLFLNYDGCERYNPESQNRCQHFFKNIFLSPFLLFPIQYIHLS